MNKRLSKVLRIFKHELDDDAGSIIVQSVSFYDMLLQSGRDTNLVRRTVIRKLSSIDD